MSRATDPIEDDPVFVCGPHRSRSTYLQRLLNIHPRLVVWGEQGGLINRLAELDRIGGLQAQAREPPDAARLEMFVAKRLDVLLDFDPWLNPFQGAGLREHHRRLLTGVFRRGLGEDQRWGVKEIRYNAPETTGFIAELYPRAQFLILRRDLVELCVSNILADWSAARLLGMGAGATLDSAREVLADCAYALCAVDAQLQASAGRLGPRALAIGDARIAESMEQVFRFLDLTPPDGFAQAAELFSRLKLGETPKAAAVGRLDRTFIVEHASDFIAQARQDIAAQGLDLARLRGLSGRGRYCFLAGDQDLQGTGLSSLF
jgi:Sulfotransferase family